MLGCALCPPCLHSLRLVPAARPDARRESLSPSPSAPTPAIRYSAPFFHENFQTCSAALSLSADGFTSHTSCFLFLPDSSGEWRVCPKPDGPGVQSLAAQFDSVHQRQPLVASNGHDSHILNIDDRGAVLHSINTNMSLVRQRFVAFRRNEPNGNREFGIALSPLRGVRPSLSAARARFASRLTLMRGHSCVGISRCRASRSPIAHLSLLSNNRLSRCLALGISWPGVLVARGGYHPTTEQNHDVNMNERHLAGNKYFSQKHSKNKLSLKISSVHFSRLCF